MGRIYCEFCKKDVDGSLETQSGQPTCEECADSRCQLCLEGDMEMENSDGEYVCIDCHSSAIDAMHDYYQER